MATARYWKIAGLDAPGSGDLRIAQLVLRNSAGAAIPVTISCPLLPSAGSVGLLADGDANTYAQWSRANISSAGFALLVDAGAAVDVAKVELTLWSSTEVVAGIVSRSSSPTSGWEMTFALNGDNPFWPFTVLSMRFDGPDGSTAFTDDMGKVITRSGSVSMTSANAASGSSARFTGNGAQLQIANHPDFDLSVSDFTIQFWLYLRAWAGSSLYGTVISKRWTGASHDWTIINTGTELGLQYFNGSSGAAFLSMGNHADARNTWTLFTVTRQGNRLRTYKGQTLQQEAVLTANLTNNATGNITIGQSMGYSDSYLNADLDELRILKGVALAPGDFPTVPSPLPGPSPIPTRKTLVMRPRTFTKSEAYPAFAMRSYAVANFADVEFGGRGRIWGTNEIETAPNVRVPTGGRVILMRQRDKLVARETWANPITGAWEFTSIDTRPEYLVLAEDLDGNYRPVAASKLMPEVA